MNVIIIFILTLGLKLSNDSKHKAKIIENLKRKNEELITYKKGYEKSLKEIKKDMLVLKFVNKTKSQLIRKYSNKVRNAQKIFDCTDLREPLGLFLS